MTCGAAAPFLSDGANGKADQARERAPPTHAKARDRLDVVQSASGDPLDVAFNVPGHVPTEGITAFSIHLV